PSSRWSSTLLFSTRRPVCQIPAGTNTRPPPCALTSSIAVWIATVDHSPSVAPVSAMDNENAGNEGFSKAGIAKGAVTDAISTGRFAAPTSPLCGTSVVQSPPGSPCWPHAPPNSRPTAVVKTTISRLAILKYFFHIPCIGTVVALHIPWVVRIPRTLDNKPSLPSDIIQRLLHCRHIQPLVMLQPHPVFVGAMDMADIGCPQYAQLSMQVAAVFQCVRKIEVTLHVRRSDILQEPQFFRGIVRRFDTDHDIRLFSHPGDHFHPFEQCGP